jgi:3-phenylpropionate/cinnamic acid dioxygenase small subunit
VYCSGQRDESVEGDVGDAKERMAAELEIRNVIARLAQLADAGDTDAYVQLMTEDVIWAMPANPSVGLPPSERRGREEIAAGQRERVAAGVQGPDSNSMHVITTTAVDVRGDDEATAASHFLYVTATVTEPQITNVGRYADEFRRTDTGWKLARRTIRFG